MKQIPFQQALDENLQIFKPHVKQTFRIIFKGMTEAEQICYIMCNICGWSHKRLAKHLYISHDTVRQRALSAARKRKPIFHYRSSLVKQLQRVIRKK